MGGANKVARLIMSLCTIVGVWGVADLQAGAADAPLDRSGDSEHRITPGFDIIVVPRRELLVTSLALLEAEYRTTVDRYLRRRG